MLILIGEPQFNYAIQQRFCKNATPDRTKQVIEWPPLAKGPAPAR